MIVSAIVGVGLYVANCSARNDERRNVEPGTTNPEPNREHARLRAQRFGEVSPEPLAEADPGSGNLEA